MRPSKKNIFKWFASASLISALLIAGSYALKGLGLALLIVSAMFLTIEYIPGFHYFATSRIGLPITVVATGFVLAKVVSITTIVGMFAMAFALIIKTGLLIMARAVGQLETVPAFAE